MRQSKGLKTFLLKLQQKLPRNKQLQKNEKNNRRPSLTTVKIEEQKRTLSAKVCSFSGKPGILNLDLKVG